MAVILGDVGRFHGVARGVDQADLMRTGFRVARLRHLPTRPLSVRGRQAGLCKMSDSLLQASDAGARSRDHALRRTENDTAASGAGRPPPTGFHKVEANNRTNAKSRVT